MRKQIKVLHIAECAGGVERYLQMLLPRLEAKGLPCKVVYNPHGWSLGGTASSSCACMSR